MQTFYSFQSLLITKLKCESRAKLKMLCYMKHLEMLIMPKQCAIKYIRSWILVYEGTWALHCLESNRCISTVSDIMPLTARICDVICDITVLPTLLLLRG